MSESIPDEFIKVMRDFIGDIKTTFPEYVPLINKWWKTQDQYTYIEDLDDRQKAFEKGEAKSMKIVFDHCKKKIPPRFFDILYQNVDMFKIDSEIDTEFFPKIHFKNLWQCDISEKTRETIWKYLQLVLFSIVGSLDNKDAFGDTAKLFEAVNEDEFKQKLQETMSQMNDLFDMSGVNMNDGSSSRNIPNAEEINEHLSGVLDGKIGQLAKEIAEDAALSLGINFDDASSSKDIFANLIKTPTKLMGLLKTVGEKLDAKLKSGEIKESEMIQEATDIMHKMKSMPGMGNLQSMMSKLGMNMSGGGKIDTAAMEAKMKHRLKLAKTKERIRAKAEANALAKAAQLVQQQQSQQPVMTIEETLSYINAGEKPEKTPRSANPNNNKNQKNKKKKGG